MRSPAITSKQASPDPDTFAHAAWDDVRPWYEEREVRSLAAGSVAAWLADWSRLESALSDVARPAPLQYAGPAPAASTAPGSPSVHLAWQAELVRSAFED